MTTTQNLDIFKAIQQNDIKSVKQLLENETNTNIQNSNGWTPLHVASCGRVDIVKLLLEHCANPNIQDKYGYTPLMEASFYNKHDIIMLLIDYGADYNLINYYSRTAFSYESGDFIREYLKSQEHQIVLK